MADAGYKDKIKNIFENTEFILINMYWTVLAWAFESNMQMRKSLKIILLTLITKLISLNCSDEISWGCNTSILSDENVCHCGNVTIHYYSPDGDLICLDSSTCQVDNLGNVTCPDGIVETEPFFFGGKCNVHERYTTSVPCQQQTGDIKCSSTDYL